ATRGTAWIRGKSLFGNAMVKLSLEKVTRRSAPTILPPALANAMRTQSNNPNSRKAARTDSNVNSVRVLRRNRAAQTRWKYFMQAQLRTDRRAYPYPGATRDGRAPRLL